MACKDGGKPGRGQEKECVCGLEKTAAIQAAGSGGDLGMVLKSDGGCKRVWDTWKGLCVDGWRGEATKMDPDNTSLSLAHSLAYSLTLSFSLSVSVCLCVCSYACVCVCV